MARASLAAVSATAGTLTLNITNNEAANTPYFVEINRAVDFSSDDTIFFQLNSVPAGTSAFTIPGLPSSTSWFVRVSSRFSGDGSNVVLLATQPVAAATSYTGFSIDKAMLVVPSPIIGLGYEEYNAAGVPGFPASNLLADSPAATFRMSNPRHFGLNFATSGEPVDTFAMLGSLCNDSFTWAVDAFDENGNRTFQMDGGQFRCSPTLGQRRTYHALMRFPAPRTERRWRINVGSPDAVMFIARHLVVGLARQSVNASRGWSHGMNDLGTAGLTRFGDPDIVPGWRGKTVDFEMSWLTEREYQTKWADIPQLVGRTKPVLVIPNSKRNIWLNDRIGYGTITDWRAENVQGSRYSNSLAINSIY